METTVLIVTEDVNARIITETLLETHGFCVRSAADGAEACDLLCRRSTAVVVLDVADGNAGAGRMVDELKNGLDNLPVSVRPRILALADADNPEGSHRVLQRGADAVLHKPVSPRRLLMTVEHLLTGPH